MTTQTIRFHRRGTVREAHDAPRQLDGAGRLSRRAATVARIPFPRTLVSRVRHPSNDQAQPLHVAATPETILGALDAPAQPPLVPRFSETGCAAIPGSPARRTTGCIPG
jgi:hypothetical protein